MGVQLTQLLTGHETSTKELAGQRFAVDAYNVLYQFLTTIRMQDGTPLKDSHGNVTSHLNGLFNRTTALMAEGLKLVFVFDGEPPKLKAEESERRRGVRDEAKQRYKEAEQAEDVEAMQKYAGRAATLTSAMVDEAKALLEALGIPTVQAPSEGEAQAAHLCKKGDVDGVISQDADAFLFGATRVVRNLSITRRRKQPGKLSYERVSPLILELEENLRALGIERERLIALAMLVGTDYNKAGIKGIGPKKALKLVQQHEQLDDIFKAAGWSEAYPELAWKRVYDTFIEMPATDEYRLVWHLPRKERLHELLVQRHDFSAERIETALERIEKAGTHAQKGLGDFL